MANTITNLTQTIYTALDKVSREMVGFIPAVTRNSTVERAAKDQTIRYPIVPAYAAADITPAATGPSPSATTVGSDTMTISKSRSVTFYWEGEEELGLSNSGNYNVILTDQFAQAMRELTNEIEVDLGLTYKSSSRAYGTAGTTPFASSLSDLAQAKKILKDNGAPMSDLQCVVDTTAGVNLLELTQLTNVNQAGDADLLRAGAFTRPIFGIQIHESAGIASHTKGTGTGYIANGGEPVGETTIAADTGTGTILAGDVITYAADTTNKYVVDTALSGGTFGVQDPGLLVAMPDSNAITVGNSYTANLVFPRSAIHLVTRAPAMPSGGDNADDRMVVQDPVSGIAFDVGVYRQYHRVAFEVGIAWGYKAANGKHMCTLLG